MRRSGHLRPNIRLQGGRSAAVLASLLLTGAIAVAGGCGGDQPPSAATRSELEAAVSNAPAPLKKLYSRPAEIVDGGPSGFREQLRLLRGYPIVVNKWASWCGPCRFEFPFFQRLARGRGTKIAFLGVDSLDARDDAKKFLAKYPVPYPSFFDPKGDVAKVFRGERVAPTTAFYGADGELAFTKQGGYASLSALTKDVDRYSR
jgi:cytochrome c biogenesis protein CcmG/thiol:disulfide interchange protein DsbE